ncbi:MAG: hypothetical protein M3Q30_15960 [Actinomycetota bacterium]|nr:hypothetical protein [Actinomycetota bacterium]
MWTFVADVLRGWGAEQRPTDPNRVGRRGIALIDRLANRWGTRDETDGKTVWVELADA